VACFLVEMPNYTTADAHVAGESVRLVVAGAPTIAGRTMLEKLAWLRRHGDAMRRTLMLEPRGHQAMHGALLTEPEHETSHAGVLSMHAAGFPLVSGEGIIAAVTIALEQSLIDGAPGSLVIDTPVGEINAQAKWGATPTGSARARVESVVLEWVPSFVLFAGARVRLGTRTLRADLAFAGEFYAIVDGEAAGIPIDSAHTHSLVEAAGEITSAIQHSFSVIHPVDKSLTGVQGVIFTGPARTAADLRSATVLEGGVLRRSPGITGTCALVAVLDAMGLVDGDRPFTHEGLIETSLRARVTKRETAGEIPIVTTSLEGSAWPTGRHEFDVDRDDPLQPFEIG
jgi:proline racemase